MSISELILNLLLVLFLGLLIAFNPSLIVINLLLVLESKRPIRDSLILIAGVILPLVVILLAVVFWLKPDSTFQIRDSLPDIKLPPLIDILFGFGLLVYVARRLARKPEPERPSAVAGKAKRMLVSPGSIFSFGFIRSGLSLTSLLAILMIAKTMVVNQAGAVMAFLAVTLAFAIGVAPLLAAPYLYKYNPSALNKARARIDKLLARGLSTVVTVLLAAIGVGFLMHGTAQVNGGR
jgi:hypothetical protein